MNNHLFVSTIFLVLVFLTIYLVHVTFYIKEKKSCHSFKTIIRYDLVLDAFYFIEWVVETVWTSPLLPGKLSKFFADKSKNTLNYYN